ncbi:SprT-like domain-containing protein [Bacillus sp. NPDC094106]|uniref:SprT-like domain-containing protein n=1 Tax=Bacillus sp. NPDC094106 TaxID=3363949 RepID=UPI0037F9684F
MIKFSIEELTTFAKEFLKKEYGIPLVVDIEMSKKMTRRFAIFYGEVDENNGERTPKVIRLSKNLLLYHDKKTILDILKHELIHYACFVTGNPYTDGSSYFKDELKRLGVLESKKYPYKGKVYYYQCQKCGYSFFHRIKHFEKKYIHNNCEGRFRFIEEGIVQ